MSRLYEALERARELGQRDPTVAPEGGRSEALSPPAIHQTVVPDRAPRVEPPTPSHTTTAIRCPACDKVQDGVLRAPWKNRVYGMLGIPLYRCRSCRRRFSEAIRQTDEPVTNHLEGRVFSSFLRPADNRTFDDVIRDMARDEREQGDLRPGSTAGHGTATAAEWELKKP